MQIANWKSRMEQSRRRVSATIDGREAFVTLPAEFDPAPSADPFLLASLVKAMQATPARPVQVEGALPLSPTLKSNLGEYQHYYRSWYPNLGAVEINAAHGTPPSLRTGHIACFYSGGVDSLYSIGRHLPVITHLVLQRGFDVPFTEVNRWERMLAAAAEFANTVGKPLVVLETNFREVCLAAPEDNHGAVLAAPVLLLGADRLIIPSSDPPNLLTPLGSHPLTDPCCSNGITQVVHDRMARRTDKVRYIVESGIGLPSLRVCNRFAEYNCGACEKCLRTMVALEALGAQSDSLPPFRVSLLEGITLWSEGIAQFWIENRQLAVEVGRPDLVKGIDGLLNRWRRKQLLRELDTQVLGGRIRRFFAARRARGIAPH